MLVVSFVINGLLGYWHFLFVAGMMRVYARYGAPRRAFMGWACKYAAHFGGRR